MSDQFGKDRNQELIDKIYDLMDEGPEEIIEYLEDYIRQLIGRELLKETKWTGINYGFCVTEEYICEVCKLGEDNE